MNKVESKENINVETFIKNLESLKIERDLLKKENHYLSSFYGK